MRDAVHHENHGLAGALGFFGAYWYLGNIKGSADAAREYNMMVRNAYLDDTLRGAEE